MAKPVAPSQCPCGSRAKYKRCCRPLHEGCDAASPEMLMRARYSAFVLGRVRYIIETTVPLGPQWRSDRGAWSEDLERYCQQVTFRKLTILSSPPPTTGATSEGEVHFRAEFVGPNGMGTLVERSRFLQIGGSWLYHSGRSE
jgi:SEC-C motif-containing protein